MDRVKVSCWLAIGCLVLFFHPVSHAEDQSTTDSSTTTNTTQLKPQMRSQPLSNAKYNLDTADMASYLDNIVMFDSAEQYESQPYILGYADATTMGGAGAVAYAAGIDENDKLSAYTILKINKSLINPDTNEELGVMAQVIGAAEVKQYGDPQTIIITSSLEHIDIGSRLIPRTALDLPEKLNAKTPSRPANGYILYVATPKTGVGKLATVVVSLGDRDGLQQGDLLDCMENTKQFSNKSGTDSTVESTVFGEILLYKVMEKVSLGFVLSSSRPLSIGDRVAAIPQG